MNINKQPFGATLDGAAVDLYTLSNDNGLEARITNYGGIVVSLLAPDKTGALADVVLGHESLAGYLTASPYFGCIVGRYGNRIAKGRFALNGVEYSLATNDGPNSLHGGLVGFDKKVWQASGVIIESGAGVVLRHTSSDGEEGYPGQLHVVVIYILTNANELRIAYSATTDKDTVLNLTNHTYFNLAGKGDILGHEMQIFADHFTPVDATLIPTGELRSLDGSPLDFRASTAIGARIQLNDEQLVLGKGYDHNFVVNGQADTLRPAVRVTEPTTGRALELHTTEPGVQFYSGNFLDGTVTGKNGAVYAQRSGFCLETQHFPDSPNQPGFPSTVLKPGETYRSTTVFKFGVA
jgi:aldose 1-epimerase